MQITSYTFMLNLIDKFLTVYLTRRKISFGKKYLVACLGAATLILIMSYDI